MYIACIYNSIWNDIKELWIVNNINIDIFV